jgi:hypothetical protein
MALAWRNKRRRQRPPEVLAGNTAFVAEEKAKTLNDEDGKL